MKKSSFRVRSYSISLQTGDILTDNGEYFKINYIYYYYNPPIIIHIYFLFILNFVHLIFSLLYHLIIFCMPMFWIELNNNCFFYHEKLTSFTLHKFCNIATWWICFFPFIFFYHFVKINYHSLIINLVNYFNLCSIEYNK